MELPFKCEQKHRTNTGTKFRKTMCRLTAPLQGICCLYTYSAADNYNDCAFSEKNIKFVAQLVYGISLIFRYGGKSALTLETRKGQSKVTAIFHDVVTLISRNFQVKPCLKPFHLYKKES